MTQTLDVHERISELGGSPQAASQSATTAVTASKAGRFAFVFGISFAILYTLFEQMNWPLFTYHPAVGKLDFWMQRARSGEGPGMYWYGWLALAFPTAALVGWVSTLASSKWLYRATVFCCVLAILWSVIFAVLVLTDGRTSFDTDLVKSMGWWSAIPGLLGALVISYFVPLQWAQRVFTSWLLIMPIGGLIILGYSLKSFFLR
jgi:uncharacterized membrane protein YdcZ (DUF606 family)